MSQSACKGSGSIYDSPDLMQRVKTAHEKLMKNQHFLTKYRKPIPVDPIAKKPELNADSAEMDRKSGSENKLQDKVQENKIHIINKVKVSSDNLTHSHLNAEKGTPRAEPFNTTTATSTCNTLLSPLSAPSTPSTLCPSAAESLHIKKSRPIPCIPLTPEEARARRCNHNRNSGDTTPALATTPAPILPANVIPANLKQRKPAAAYAPFKSSPLVYEVTETSSSGSSWDRALEDTPARALTTEINDEGAAPVKMSDTDDSGVVFGGRRANILPQHEPSPSKERAQRRRKIPESLPRLQGKEPHTNYSADGRRISQVSRLESEDCHRGVAIPDEKENRREAGKDPKDELARLQKEIVAKAHRGPEERDVACPEMLARCRDGPGTDRSSQVYHDIANLRLVPHEQVDDCILGSSHVFSEVPLNADPGMLERDMESRMRLYREYYKKSPTAYPISTGESMILSPIPTEEHRKILAKLRKSHPDPERERTGDSRRKSTSDAKGKETVQVFETKWSDPMIVDWEYCPRYVPDERGYHLRFQSWLEDTIKEKCLVDIFHQAFFNGTAHPDGETSMFVMDMRNYETRLRPDDKEGWAHAHETAAGYCHNVILQNRQVREAEEHRKRMARKAWLQAEARRSQPLPTPSSPKANVYLRPVDVGRDLEALAKIYNWYAYNSATSPDTQALDHDEVRQRVEETINAKLPFIVAVDRGSTSAKRAEKILGYACAREFDGFHRAANSVTAELELYVNNEHLNEGIGKCLLDKLLEVCDPTYTPNCGYIFEARREDRPGYYPGGRRRLARMIFMLCYVDHTDVTDHDRAKKWLEEHAGFEQQGLLRGARVKNHKFINVAYLVRSSADGNGDEWRP